MLDNIRELVKSANGHVQFDREADGTRVSLWTRGARGVTRPDLSLASRIDDLIDRVSPAS